ncbi:MAG: peptide chain release factor N(5)-glutamine methyltransferase [Xanthobacteraceae bacterium]|nr:peptide chain release factor N(5)-glutamine methyltransferase [Xanthobacteraceae bacterium]
MAVDFSHAGRTVEAARRALAARLRNGGVDSPELDARLLIGAVLGLDLTGLIAQAARRLTADEQMRLDRWAARRIAGEPVARLLGRKEFWGLDFALSPATLVPRPDTETIVEAARDIVRADGRQDDALRIVDIGTGSGAILLALLRELPRATGVGTDISLDALRTARDNAVRLGLSGRIAFVAGDYLAALAGPFDLIISNPPYIPSGDIAALAVEVREHDPRRALDGGGDGLDAYRTIARQAAGLLADGGTLILEIGQHQGDDVTRLADAAGLAPHGRPRADLGGVPRALAFRRSPR